MPVLLLFGANLWCQPLAMANMNKDFDNTCEKILDLAETKIEKGCKSNPTSSDCTTINQKIKEIGGDNYLSYCMQADLARKGRNNERVKQIISTVGGLACSISMYRADPTTCMIVNHGVMLESYVQDEIWSKVIRNKSKEYKETIDAIGSIKWQGYQQLVTSAIPSAVMGASQIITDGASPAAGCIICIAGMAFVGGRATMIGSKFTESMAENIANAQTIQSGADESISGIASRSINKPAFVDQTETNGPRVTVADDCKSKTKSGDEALKCFAKTSPEVAAISNNPKLMKAFKKFLKNKSLGDLLKEDDGKTDVRQQVAAAAGVTSSQLGKAMSIGEKFATAVDFEKIASSSMAYSSSSSSSIGSGSGDRSSSAGVSAKELGGSLGLNDEASVEFNQTEMLFRQLDLLSAEQIQADPKISLFVRAAYRYRKNVNKIEKLDTMLDQRAPASERRQ